MFDRYNMIKDVIEQKTLTESEIDEILNLHKDKGNLTQEQFDELNLLLHPVTENLTEE